MPVPTRRRLLILAVLFEIGYLQAGLGPVLPALRDELDLSYGSAGLHLTAFAAGGLLAGLLERPLERRLGRMSTIWSGSLGMALGVCALAAAPVLAVTLASAAVMGLTGTWAVIAIWATVSDEYGDGRASAMSEGEAMVSFGSLTVPLAVASATAAGLGWRAALLAGAAWACVAAGAFRGTRLAEDSSPRLAEDSSPRAAAVISATPPPGMLLTLLAVFCLGGTEWSLGFWGATYLEDVGGLPASTAAAGLSGFFAAMLAGRLLTARLTRRVPAPRVLAGALALTGAGVVVFWAAPSASITVAALALCGLGIAATFPLTLALALEAAPGAASLVSGRVMAAASLSVLLAPLALGQLADAVGLRSAVAVVPALLGLGTLAAVAARAQQRVVPRWRPRDPSRARQRA